MLRGVDTNIIYQGPDLTVAMLKREHADFHIAALTQGYAVDINLGSGSADKGKPVYACAPGDVVDVRPSDGTIRIRHDGGYETQYSHMALDFKSGGKPKRRKVGDPVRLHQQIGRISDVTDAIDPETGLPVEIDPHLHHCHWRDGQAIAMRFYGQDQPAFPASVADPRNPGPHAVVGKKVKLEPGERSPRATFEIDVRWAPGKPWSKEPYRLSFTVAARA